MPRDALDALLSAGFPAAPLALYGRWWRLETWLREMIYTELRARDGVRWESALGKAAPTRAQRDEINGYMASPDAGDLLAYLDVGPLFDLIDSEWPLFEHCLPPRIRWTGMADELRAIRHRIAHMRRPHFDDLARLEQASRDLEAGAQRFCSTYAIPRPYARIGPVGDGWGQRH